MLLYESFTGYLTCACSHLSARKACSSAAYMQVNCFRAIIATTPGDLLATVYLCTNQIAPSHEGIELGIGDATLVKVQALPLASVSCLHSSSSQDMTANIVT